MKLTIITPTIRREGLDIVRKSLRKQTFKNFEWLICSRFDPKIPEAIWIPDNFTGGHWSLNRAYNALLKFASGDIIVTWQDWIYAGPDALQKFVDKVEETNSVVSGVGNQYARLNKYGKPELQVWSDPRETDKYGNFYECHWNDAEFNFAAFPRELFTLVGGFDEKLDFLGVGGDQLQFCERLNDAGEKFYLDQTNKSFTLRHDRSDFGGQEKWDSKHVLFKKGESGMSLYDERKAQLKLQGQWSSITPLTE